jgi:hypothetical protein
MPRPGHRVQALLLQFILAFHAGAVCVVPDASNRFVDELEQAAVGVGLAEQELLGIRIGGLVGKVDSGVVVRRPPLFFCPGDRPQQFLTTRQQFLFVIFETFLIHRSGPTVHSWADATNG